MGFGHQLHLLTTITILGTNKPLTMNVSNNTPNPTPNPSCAIACKGSVNKTKKVPANIIPADVITPPVLVTASLVHIIIPLVFTSSFTLDIM